MDFIKTPVKGMRDYLPEDFALRQEVIGMIRDTYSLYGFTEIETPAIEHIENLSNKQGGENEKLIFKILKRGRELERALASDDGQICDSGLRYDLTVPLSRYYANNVNDLPSPFKSLQIGSVWRADNPQKGRFRQFTQCDIDILGDATNMAEIELISATSTMIFKIFSRVGITDFTVHVSDRRILRGMAHYAGFAEEDYDDVFIILDKFDKIGLDGVEQELAKKGYDPQAIAKYVGIFDKSVEGASCGEFCGFLRDGHVEHGCVEGLDTILRAVKGLVPEGVSIVFDPTLVRGMSYYTGTIFECTIDGYGFSIAGGGRYDKMIGKFSGMDVPACGFSIGFERIITILSDHAGEFQMEARPKCAILIQKNLPTDKMLETLEEAKKLREEGTVVSVQTMRKNVGRQAKMLEEEGYADIRKVYAD